MCAGVSAVRLLLGRQELDQRLVQPERGRGRRAGGRYGRGHLRDRGDGEPRVQRDRDAEPAMREPAGVLEDRGAVAPGDGDATEGVGGDSLVEPGAELGSFMRRLSPVAADTMRSCLTSAARRIVDLSHPIEAGMVTYPGLPVPEIHAVLDRATSAGRYAPGVTFQIDLITLCGNTGTYMDSPFHRWEDGADLAGLPPERLIDLPAVRIDVTGSATPARRRLGLRRPRARGSRGPRPHRVRPVLADRRLPARQPVPDPRRRRAAGGGRRRARGHRLRSTSTRPRIPSGRRTRSCSRPASRSSST